jgi:hypothetical protein
MTRPSVSQRLRSHVLGNPSRAKEAETVLSRNMHQHGLWRADMLGSKAGMWSLHPQYRSELFYQELPELIDRIEKGDVPDEQRGYYELNDSMIDWRDQRRKNTRLRRMLSHLSRLAERMNVRPPEIP